MPNCGALLIVANLDQISFYTCDLICAHFGHWRRVVQVRVLRCDARCRKGFRKPGACGQYLRNQRDEPHKCDRMNSTSPPHRRAGWQIGPLSLKLVDHCGPPNRIRAGHTYFPETLERSLTALAIVCIKGRPAGENRRACSLVMQGSGKACCLSSASRRRSTTTRNARWATAFPWPRPPPKVSR